MTGRIIRISLLAVLCLGFSSAAHALCLLWDPSVPGGYRDAAGGYRSIPINAEFERAFMVVVATVRSERRLPGGFMKHEVTPTETFKGPNLDAFTIFDEVDSGRFDMDVGKTYLLFVRAVEKRSEVDSCGWSDELSAASETLQRVRALAASN